MRVAAVGLTPADLAVSCGGTLARYADDGHEVSAIVLRDGPELADTTGRARLDELIKGLGLSHGETLGVEQGATADDRSQRDALADELRASAPDVIFAPGHHALISEARALAALVFGAAYCACVPNYRTPAGRDAVATRAQIMHGDPVLRFDSGNPEYVDIGAVWERKLAALRAVASPDHAVATAEICARARGIQVQLEFAEAFGREPAWGRLRTFRLLP